MLRWVMLNLLLTIFADTVSYSATLISGSKNLVYSTLTSLPLWSISYNIRFNNIATKELENSCSPRSIAFSSTLEYWFRVVITVFPTFLHAYCRCGKFAMHSIKAFKCYHVSMTKNMTEKCSHFCLEQWHVSTKWGLLTFALQFFCTATVCYLAVAYFSCIVSAMLSCLRASY